MEIRPTTEAICGEFRNAVLLEAFHREPGLSSAQFDTILPTSLAFGDWKRLTTGDANKTGEETRWQLHKNAACNPEQVGRAGSKSPQGIDGHPAPYHESVLFRLVAPVCPLAGTIYNNWMKQRWTHKRVLFTRIQPTHGSCKSVGRPARTWYIGNGLCEDNRFCPLDDLT